MTFDLGAINSAEGNSGMNPDGYMSPQQQVQQRMAHSLFGGMPMQDNSSIINVAQPSQMQQAQAPQMQQQQSQLGQQMKKNATEAIGQDALKSSGSGGLIGSILKFLI